MKIYQVHEIGGIWEDSYDFVYKTFLNKEKAEMFCTEMNNKYIESLRCNKCPIEYYDDVDCDSDLECEDCKNKSKCTEERIKKTKEYCDNFVLQEVKSDEDIGVSCKNFNYVIDDNVEYYVKEEEVD